MKTTEVACLLLYVSPYNSLCAKLVFNISLAIVGVPYFIFLTASLVGLIPYTFLLVRTVMTLNDIQSFGFHFNTMLSLTG